MKNLAVIFVFLFGITLVSVAQKAENKVVCFKSNMDCADCEKTLTDNLKFEKGVKDLKIDHVSNTIYVEYKDGKNSDEGLAKAIEKKGYLADKITPEQYKELVENAKEEGHHHGEEVHKIKK
jgi:copper chaperone CopZ